MPESSLLRRIRIFHLEKDSEIFHLTKIRILIRLVEDQDYKKLAVLKK